jgi:outer membrane protein assembly factor BamA
LACAGSVAAIPLDALDSARQWRVKDIDFSGNKKISKDELDEIMTTKERPWYRFWEDRPVFDPVTFGTDLERLQRLYESRGFYGTSLSPDLEVDEADALMTAHIPCTKPCPW